MKILSDSQFVQTFTDDAQKLLEKFIESSISVSGKTFNVYGVHHLKHLIEDCKRHGDLESFSAFKYESHLGVLKRLLHASGRILSQIVCRLLEEISNMPTPEAPLTLNIQVFMPCGVPESVNLLGKGYKKIIINKRIKMTAGKSFLSKHREENCTASTHY
ncbi:Lipoyl synthase, apicoplast [Frankliniella fusca]|uniref:Lipoyl synthase, apicoplast n=1 Tax=Frankliniella fusca TaxID=407009 RepID=A0AAE1HJJ9_9NEOP|nr:Lipoyl synthase, apicoplast [Frankliniella fusca]